MENEAIGQYEAAALMAVNFTRPTKMAQAGQITAHLLGGNEHRAYHFFERRQCEQNWQRYLVERPGRPREKLTERQEILRLLDDPSRPRIAVDDAIGTAEAARILNCFQTLIPRLATSGQIVGRRLLSMRGGNPRIWIFSRTACLAHKEVYDRMLAEGRKRGRRRGDGMKPFEEWTSCLINYLDLVREEIQQEQNSNQSENRNHWQPVGSHLDDQQLQDFLEKPNKVGNRFWHSHVAV